MRDENGKFIKGHVPWHKGKTGVYSNETIKKMSKAKIKDDVGYVALHEWVRKNKKRTNNCQKCSRKNIWTDMANISGEYYREVDDYIELCRKCHFRMDHGQVKNQYGIWNLKNGKND